jgi:hypothetical protein
MTYLTQCLRGFYCNITYFKVSVRPTPYSHPEITPVNWGKKSQNGKGNPAQPGRDVSFGGAVFIAQLDPGSLLCRTWPFALGIDVLGSEIPA